MARNDVLFALDGSRLSQAELDALDARLQQNAEDVDARLQLLGSSMRRSFVDPSLREKRVEHALWFIENRPESEIVGSPLCWVDAREPGFARAVQAWERAIDASGKPRVILSAARFFTRSDPKRSRELLERGELLAPSWPTWADQIGEDLFRTVRGARRGQDQGRVPQETEDELREISREALSHFERALGLVADPRGRFPILPQAAEAALEAGVISRAVQYADETIAVAPSCPHERHAPDFLHDAHIVRGRVFLIRDDVSRASEELQLAGALGSDQAPVLRSFGPDFHLANGLLARDAAGTVRRYLEQCETFWNPMRVRKWLAALDRGERPRMFTGFDPDEGPHRG